MDKYLIKKFAQYTNDQMYASLTKVQTVEELTKIIEPIYNDTLGARPRKTYRRQLAHCILRLYDGDFELMKYYQIMGLLKCMPIHIQLNTAKTFKISIPHKMAKKGNNKNIAHKILQKYDNIRLQEFLHTQSTKALHMSWSCLQNKSLTAAEKYDTIVQQVMSDKDEDKMARRMTIIYSGMRSIGSDQMSKHVFNLFDSKCMDEYCFLLIDMHYIHTQYKLAKEETKPHVTMQQLMQQAKQLQNQMVKQEKHQNYLKQELQKKHVKEKELKGEINELTRQLRLQLDEAIKEIGRLEHLLETQQQAQAENLFHYQNQITRLERIIESQQIKDDYKPLSDVTVCVLGDPKKKEAYHDVVQKYGGSFEFSPSTSDSGLSAMVGPAGRSDIVLYLTSYTNHTIGNKLKSIIDTSKIKHLNATGIEHFENELLNKVIPMFNKNI